MESQPQNPVLRNNPEKFHPCRIDQSLCVVLIARVLADLGLYKFGFVRVTETLVDVFKLASLESFRI